MISESAVTEWTPVSFDPEAGTSGEGPATAESEGEVSSEQVVADSFA